VGSICDERRVSNPALHHAEARVLRYWPACPGLLGEITDWPISTPSLVPDGSQLACGLLMPARVGAPARRTRAQHAALLRTHLVFMRRDGDMPYGWLADNTRWQRKPKSYSSVAHALKETAKFYRYGTTSTLMSRFGWKRTLLSISQIAWLFGIRKSAHSRLHLSGGQAKRLGKGAFAA
jgi:hypothetical protein